MDQVNALTATPEATTTRGECPQCKFVWTICKFIVCKAEKHGDGHTALARKIQKGLAIPKIVEVQHEVPRVRK